MLKTIYLYLSQHESLVSLLSSRENIFIYSLIKQLYFDIQSWWQGARQLCSGDTKWSGEGFPVIARRRGDVPPRLLATESQKPPVSPPPEATHPWVSLTRVPGVSGRCQTVSHVHRGRLETITESGRAYSRPWRQEVNTSLVNENSNKLCLLWGKI